jgi:SAM-dependent methyltransferase
MMEHPGNDSHSARYLAAFYPESRFSGLTSIDGTVAFYIPVHALVGPESTVLEIGSGRGVYGEDPIPVRRDLRIFKGRCRKVIGIDVDPGAASNPFLDEFRLIEKDHWPVADESIDVSICDSVLEHVENPDSFFNEVRRVTRPGGFICIRTSNVLSYFGLASVLVPSRLHFKTLARLQDGSPSEHDVFPTFYRCNTRRQLRKILDRYGFDHTVYGYEPEPAYLSFSRIAYALGVLHQKLAPNLFKVALLAYARKMPAADAADRNMNANDSMVAPPNSATANRE